MPSGTVTPAGGGGVATVAAADGSIVVAGTATAPTVATGTLDAIATAHAPVAAVAVNAQKITGLANGAAASDAAAFGQIPAASALAGYEYDYVQITSNVACTATSEAAANTIITGSAVTYDGSTTVLVSVYFPSYTVSDILRIGVVSLFLDGSPAGMVFLARGTVANQPEPGGTYSRRLTPSAGSHTFSVRGWNDAAATLTVECNNASAGNRVPASLRITRV